MNLLKNYTGRDEKEVIKLLTTRYKLDIADFITSRDDSGRIIIKIISEKSVSPAIEVAVSPDSLKAYLNVYPGINTQEIVSTDDIMGLLQQEMITVNVNREAINNIVRLAGEGGISEKVLIAEGVEPISGKDANIILNFEPVKNKPRILKNGKVDYKNVDNIRVVNEGDLLLTKKPATAGVRGLTVYNTELPAEPGVETEIYSGDGVRSENNGTQFYAKSDGCVTFERNTLEVSPVYTVRGDVDYGTGNIVFNGSVYIKNDVLANFSVKAEKDIFVEGVCQDAELISGGNIVVRLGVRGEGKSVIKAKGDIFVGYVENALVEARGNIEIMKYAYNCRLRAGGSIEAVKDPGIIAGGEVTGFSEIKMIQAGTVGNSRFTISVGTKFYFENELQELKLSKDKFLENKSKIDEFLGGVNLKKKEVLENPKVRQLIALRKQLDAKIAAADAAMQKLIKEAHHPRPRLKVLNELYGGIDVQVYRERVSIRENQKNMVYMFDDKYQKIQAISLEDKDWNDE
ncbi:DUF342 domain-containing protein [Seleniivibrio woodruffii]|uniref:Flagellar Assembly Protein A N-terminal region domain-containing protein n=1 Tax=Seleniivibrio woodruffii TaxID=1078050 RepID=A0A4R1KCF0_9BACT|nr:FapA family protein [Seleniivibrio woodruffii]TCK61720.1 hypothetical protein C8D98_0226 [Seleniivibrio woodruffii]TVZ35165.1 hypothetical protein OF66_0767 [Seleniivibrio woodruffii]